jgi:hypothetical protein
MAVHLKKCIYTRIGSKCPIVPYGIGRSTELSYAPKLNEFSNAYFSNELPNVKV